MSAKQISIHSDSQLIVNQITADFAAKDASMSAYLSEAHQLIEKFQAYEIRQIPRSENSQADAFSRLASAINDRIGRKVPVEILSQPSMTTAEISPKLESYGTDRQDTQSSTMFCTSEATPRRIRSASPKSRGTTSFGKSTARSAVIIQGPGRWHTRSSGMGTSGRPYTEMQMCYSRSATNANFPVVSLTSLPSLSHQS
ncbi:unnamed protein product [Prunus armeniaca]